MAWLAEIRKSDENLLKSCKVAPVTKVQITNVYFGDVTTIENNRQVSIVFDWRDVISIVVTSSKYVGNFDRRSNLTWSFEQVFLRFTDSSKLNQFVN